MSTFHLVQSPLAWESADANCKMFNAKLESISGGTVVLPEMFSTGFSMASARLAEKMDGKTVTWMQETAAARDVSICGSVIIDEDGHYYNRFIWVTPDDPPTWYDKRHLFRMGNEDHFYQPGQEKILIETSDCRICPQVCYDLRFPVWSRNTSQFDVLLYVANWPKARREQWFTLLKARAIENLCYVVAVNRIGTDGNNVTYSGDSCVIGPQGNMLLEMGETEGINSIEPDLGALIDYRTSFPAHLDADDFEVNP